MNGQTYGIKETSELLTAMGDISVVAYKAQKSIDPSLPTGEKVQLFAQSLAAQIMTQPQVVSDLKAAFDNIGDVPKEVTDLSFREGLELVAVAGAVAAKAAAAVNN